MDPALARILIENLVDNAWKFTRRTPRARVEIGAAEIAGRPAFFVRDNGAGFDMASAGKLFTAFQRLHSPAEFPGTGIGLATCQRIVDRHGGRIWAEGQVGEGATIFFTLPPRERGA
jgi:light-regulated signal transduction histidine kinase (bacteriophytochrome)